MKVEILCVIRLFLFAMTNMMGATFIIGKVEERRQSYWKIAIFWAIKVFIQIVMCNYVLVVLYGETEWLGTLRLIVAWIYAILVYVAYCWMFKGDPLHIAIVAFIADLIVSFTGLVSIAFVNLIRGNADIWLLIDKFQITDIFMPIIFSIIVGGVCKISSSILEKLKKWEPKHKKILWTIFVLYIFGASLSNLDSYQEMTLSIVMGIILYGVAVIVFAMIAIKYGNKLEKEQRALQLKQRMMESHYEIMQGQIQRIEKSREVIAWQMEDILKTKDQTYKDGKIKQYLEQLKEDYEEIRAGVFCDNWMVDAVICSQKEQLMQKGITLECAIHGLELKKIQEQDFIQLLIILFSYVEEVSENSTVRISIKGIKNQLMIEYELPANKKEVQIKRRLDSYIKKYDGSILVYEEEQRVRVVIMLKRG